MSKMLGIIHEWCHRGKGVLKDFMTKGSLQKSMMMGGWCHSFFLICGVIYRQQILLYAKNPKFNLQVHFKRQSKVCINIETWKIIWSEAPMIYFLLNNWQKKKIQEDYIFLHKVALCEVRLVKLPNCLRQFCC